MHALPLLLVLSLYASVVEEVAGQGCVPYRGSPATGGKCDSVVTYSHVLLLPGQTYAQADSATAETTKLLGVFVPPVCRSAAIRLACWGGFVECSFSPEFSFDACEEFFTAQNKAHLLPNCSSPLFPTTHCTNGSQTAGARPTVRIRSSSTRRVCVYPCPDPMFTTTEMDAAIGVLTGLGIVSFAMVLFLIITYSLMRHKRRFPTSFQIWLSVSSLVCSVGVLLPVLVGGPRRTFCTWDEVPVLQTFEGARDNNGQGVVCVLQGMLIMYGGLAGSCWWLMLTVTGFQFIVLKVGSSRIKMLLNIGSHMVGWGVPGLCVLIGLAAQKFVGVAGGYNCFVADPWDWGLWYGPVLFNLIVGTTLMAIVILKVWRVQSRLKEVSQTVISKEHLIRLTGLIVGYWFLYAFFTFYRVYEETVADDIEDAVAEQIACGVATGEPCELSVKLNRGSWYLQAMTLGGQGVIIFCSLGLSKALEPYLFWRVLLKNWRQPMSIIRGTSSKSQSDDTMSGGKEGVSNKSSTYDYDISSLAEEGDDL
ncbi:Frizzled/Smoothened family membrane region protein [Acanthamoeba castellanii str. Neff]|uniref:Frizzled/Smoothened family membrane region protein n=1 Tax=Acanthamoeba castellanii (strain ATCC 30010 / Neff) TaxID=1257118 RepID=L8H5A3_ACACF|nr:Frizzled/Smoothened family membrane region protein [Acanthamoeba castellanii str. Neff]ELR20679.1 Frizzled/Smoothened family membrane region protein [Acanthamoeba castellanii str. Neff]